LKAKFVQHGLTKIFLGDGAAGKRLLRIVVRVRVMCDGLYHGSGI
jgi:hypothetical protein